jgi:hypothetical protein
MMTSRGSLSGSCECEEAERDVSPGFVERQQPRDSSCMAQEGDGTRQGVPSEAVLPRVAPGWAKDKAGS